MVLAGSAAQDTFWIRRVRTLTVGFLKPFFLFESRNLGFPASPIENLTETVSGKPRYLIRAEDFKFYITNR